MPEFPISPIEPAEFFESDLSLQPVCSPRFPDADGTVEVTEEGT